MIKMKERGMTLYFSIGILIFVGILIFSSMSCESIFGPSSEEEEEEEEELSYVYNPYYYGGTYGYGNYFVGSLSPVIYGTTVDSPLTPSRGMMYLIGCKLAGGIMGGDISLIKPHFE